MNTQHTLNEHFPLITNIAYAEMQDGGACTRSNSSLSRQNGAFVFFVLGVTVFLQILIAYLSHPLPF